MTEISQSDSPLKKESNAMSNSDKPVEQEPVTENTPAAEVNPELESDIEAAKLADETTEPNEGDQHHNPDQATPSTAASAASGGATSKVLNKKRVFFLLLLGVVFVCVLVLGFVLGFRWILQQNQAALEHQDQQIALLEKRLTQAEASSRQTLENLAQTHAQERQRLNTAIQKMQTQDVDIEQRVAAQAKLLRAMSDTSREDWLLAEAEYLLRLANQRIRIERSGEGVDALLSAADEILRDLNDPDLHPLRRAVAKDLAAMRLMSKIDVEGIYVALAALADHIDTLPLQFDRFAISAEPAVALLPTESSANDTLVSRIAAAWQRFVKSFGNAYRIVSIDELPKPILPPESHVYLQQNLRLMIERAQLALMREEQEIYTTTLQQADAWLEQYYSVSAPTTSFRQQLANLKNQNITHDFPDISNSLELLNNYIRELHSLKGPKSSASVKENNTQQNPASTQPVVGG